MEGALPLPMLLGPHAERLRGIQGWEDLQHLGSLNLQRLVDFAAKAMLDEASDMDRDERAQRAAALERLKGLQRSSVVCKPVLPRLRVECFRVGQTVRLLLADTPGAQEVWGSATVCEVAKRHKPEWAHHFPSRGYYWRVTAHAERPLLRGASDLAFSTSEPRVLPAEELDFLKRALHEVPDFVRIFCENARRSWNPIWCDEANVCATGEDLDLAVWLEAA